MCIENVTKLVECVWPKSEIFSQLFSLHLPKSVCVADKKMPVAEKRMSVAGKRTECGRKDKILSLHVQMISTICVAEKRGTVGEKNKSVS